jgi:hypothetical protein
MLMNTQNESGQIIRNVATLDLRTTNESTFAAIKRIENVATLIYLPETSTQITRLNIVNVATLLQAPAHATVMAGQEVLGRDAFRHQTTPLAWIISGQLLVDAGLSAEELERGVESLIISGQVLCPEPLAGVLQSKIQHMSGQFVSYSPDAKLIMGKLTFDETYLRELPDGSKLMVMGQLTATKPLPPELLRQKLGDLQVFGRILCSEENAAGLLRSMQNRPALGETTVIPSGYELVDRPLVLDAGLLETLAGRKLYCTDLVRIEAEVTPEALAQGLGGLIASKLVIAPSHLRQTLAQKCDLLATKAIFYQGALWVAEGEEELSQARFDYLEGQVTLVVLGELTVDPVVEPKLLAERLHKVHNLGEISATPVQLAALQARVGLNEGEWSDATTPVEVESSDRVIGNTAYLRL